MNVRFFILFFFFILAVPILSQAQAKENCTNGIDDDGDGDIDLNDSDCICKGIKDSLFVPSSLIPNPSFEDFTCCPTGLAQLNCSKTWIQASAATSDYYHTCGFKSDPMRGTAPNPLAAGKGFVGFLDLRDSPFRNGSYKEYVGACLNQSMTAGKVYTLSFWVGFGSRGNPWGPRASTTLGIFGTTACGNLPFGNGGSECPTAYPNWFEITKVNAAGINRWVKVKVNFNPTRNYSAIVIGPQCTKADGNYYFFIDELILEETTKFDSVNLSILGEPCQDNVKLSINPSSVASITYQWYRDGIAINGATKPKYDIPKGQEGIYVLRAFDGKECELSNFYYNKRDTFYTYKDIEICEGDFISISGKRIDQAGQYNFKYLTVNGCDSNVIVDVHINNKYFKRIDTTICEGSVIIINGKKYAATGVYPIKMNSINLCDSIVELHLQVSNVLNTSFDTSKCAGTAVLINNINYPNPGTYTWQGFSVGGCDSIVQINIRDNKTYSNVIDAYLCKGDTLRIRSAIIVDSGEYFFPFQTTNGCDSIVSYQVQLKPLYQVTIDTNICDGDYIMISNIKYDKAGIYIINLQDQFGCDSIINLALKINVNASINIDTSLCEGSSIKIGAQQYTDAGDYIQRFKNQSCCDSTIRIHIQKNLNYKTKIDTNICNGTSLVIAGRQFNQSGNYDIPLVSFSGCDSMISVHVEFGQKTMTNIDTAICDGSFIMFGNQRIEDSGIYTMPLLGKAGCDSIVNLKVNKYNIYDQMLTINLCNGDSINFGSKKYYESGTYIEKSKTINQCDSIVTLALKVYPKIEYNSKTTGIKCFGDKNASISIASTLANLNYRWSNQNTTPVINDLGEGVYKLTISDANNCKLVDSFLIKSPPPLEFDYIVQDATCRTPNNGQLKLKDIKGGTKPLKLSIDNRLINNLDSSYNVSIGTHQITLTDSNLCSHKVSIFIDEAKRGSIDIPEDTIYLTLGDSFFLKLELRDINNIDTLQWIGNGRFSCADCIRTVVTPQQDGAYIEVVLVDDAGCRYKDFVVARLKQNVYVPNVFSPNGDRINDYFNLITDSSVDRIDDLKIYDRWGELIFQSNNIQPNGEQGAWDGSFREHLAMPGVYVYMISYTNKLGHRFSLVGDITLIR